MHMFIQSVRILLILIPCLNYSFFRRFVEHYPIVLLFIFYCPPAHDSLLSPPSRNHLSSLLT